MKKVVFIMLFLFTLLIFNGCSEKTYVLSRSVNEIECVEIVLAENSFEYEVVKTLSEAEKDSFLEQLLTIEFDRYYIGDPMSINGTAIKITYQNGDYEMICHYWAEYVRDGEAYSIRRSCDVDEFNELLNNFYK